MLEKSPSVISRMFDRIAPRYDLINRVTSFGQDVQWRKRLLSYLPLKRDAVLLDLATGTGDVLITLLHKAAPDTRAIGVDISEQMIAVGNEKLTKYDFGERASLRVGDATAIPLGDEEVDLVTMAFGIRNVEDVPKALREMHRVLKPGGQTVILEFSLPRSVLIRFFYLLYFRYILPVVGGVLSGHYDAYRYLTHSVESFVYGDAFASLLKEAGFSRVDLKQLCFGVATIYIGKK